MLDATFRDDLSATLQGRSGGKENTRCLEERYP